MLVPIAAALNIYGTYEPTKWAQVERIEQDAPISPPETAKEEHLGQVLDLIA